MGKFASTIRNIFLGAIAFFIAHLSYRIYEMTLKMGITCDKIAETNELVKNLHELIQNIKFSLF